MIVSDNVVAMMQSFEYNFQLNIHQFLFLFSSPFIVSFSEEKIFEKYPCRVFPTWVLERASLYLRQFKKMYLPINQQLQASEINVKSLLKNPFLVRSPRWFPDTNNLNSSNSNK